MPQLSYNYWLYFEINLDEYYFVFGHSEEALYLINGSIWALLL